MGLGPYKTKGKILSTDVTIHHHKSSYGSAKGTQTEATSTNSQRLCTFTSDSFRPQDLTTDHRAGKVAVGTGQGWFGGVLSWGGQGRRGSEHGLDCSTFTNGRPQEGGGRCGLLLFILLLL